MKKLSHKTFESYTFFLVHAHTQIQITDRQWPFVFSFHAHIPCLLPVTGVCVYYAQQSILYTKGHVG